VKIKGLGRITQLLAALAVLCGCSGGDATAPDTATASITLFPAAAPLVAGGTFQLSAVVKNAIGGVLDGKTVAYSSDKPAVATVNSTGLVSALGPVGLVSITASNGGVTSAPALITVSAASPSSIVKIGSDPTSVLAGASYSDSIRIQVKDAFGNPNSGVTVAFALNSGGGSVTPASVITDATGKAAASFITGKSPGVNTATATVAGLNPVAFSISTSWTSISSGTSQTFMAVWGTSSSDVWAVGSGATIFHYNGATWSNVSPSGTTQILYGVWGTSPSNVWAVGRGASGGEVMFHYSGTNWTSASTATSQFLAGIWGTSSSDVWAVGGSGGGSIDGTILHYDGTSWSSAFLSGTTQIFYGVWGTSASNVWAVGGSGGGGGDPGAILHYDGANWSKVMSDTTTFRGVWGNSASDVWVVGDGGTILHYNGTAWSRVSSGTTQVLYGVWGTSASDVYALGGQGSATILHYDGTSWSKVLSGTAQLAGVWGSSTSDVWAVGVGGTLLHRSP